jgi:hypothetical protein
MNIFGLSTQRLMAVGSSDLLGPFISVLQEPRAECVCELVRLLCSTKRMIPKDNWWIVNGST